LSPNETTLASPTGAFRDPAGRLYEQEGRILPHPPGIYDREHHMLRSGGSYLDNLVLADDTLVHCSLTLIQARVPAVLR